MLRAKAQEIAELMAKVPGIVDLLIEPQVEIPQIRVTVKRDDAIRYGLSPGDVAEALETAFQGRVVSQVLEGRRVFDLVTWFDEASRNDIEVIRSTLLSTPTGAKVALGTVATVERTTGPNTINHENVLRRIVRPGQCIGRDLVGVVQETQSAVRDKIVPALPEGYFIEYGGQFEAQRDANRRLFLLGSVSLIGIFFLLQRCLGSWRAALQVMVNIPLAAIVR